MARRRKTEPRVRRRWRGGSARAPRRLRPIEGAWREPWSGPGVPLEVRLEIGFAAGFLGFARPPRRPVRACAAQPADEQDHNHAEEDAESTQEDQRERERGGRRLVIASSRLTAEELRHLRCVLIVRREE